MSFSITVIGSNSAIPAHGRHPSAQLVNIHDRIYLIDCGEGTQMRLNDLGIRWSRINQIFITHLHGDHFFGLIGVISTFHLLKRTRPLEIYAPAQLREIIELQLFTGQTSLCYEIRFFDLDPNEPKRIFENDEITVDTIILKHRIDCTGFLFREKIGQRKVIKEKLEEYNIPLHMIPLLKKGQDVIDEATGKMIPNAEVTTDPLRPRSYAYCTDTAFHMPVIKQIHEVDMLYHDSTFDEKSAQRAEETYHSTAKQAAEIAKLAEVKQLMLGHFSSKYESVYPLLDEAKEIFPNTIVAIEGRTYQVER